MEILNQPFKIEITHLNPIGKYGDGKDKNVKEVEGLSYISQTC